jgi:hypothetical protein
MNTLACIQFDIGSTPIFGPWPNDSADSGQTAAKKLCLDVGSALVHLGSITARVENRSENSGLTKFVVSGVA